VHHRAAVAGGKAVAARVVACHPEPHLGVVVPVGRDEHADGGAHADDPAARDRGEKPTRQQAVLSLEPS